MLGPNLRHTRAPIAAKRFQNNHADNNGFLCRGGLCFDNALFAFRVCFSLSLPFSDIHDITNVTRHKHNMNTADILAQGSI